MRRNKDETLRSVPFRLPSSSLSAICNTSFQLHFPFVILSISSFQAQAILVTTDRPAETQLQSPRQGQEIGWRSPLPHLEKGRQKSLTVSVHVPFLMISNRLSNPPSQTSIPPTRCHHHHPHHNSIQLRKLFTIQLFFATSSKSAPRRWWMYVVIHLLQQSIDSSSVLFEMLLPPSSSNPKFATLVPPRDTKFCFDSFYFYSIVQLLYFSLGVAQRWMNQIEIRMPKMFINIVNTCDLWW